MSIFHPPTPRGGGVTAAVANPRLIFDSHVCECGSPGCRPNPSSAVWPNLAPPLNLAPQHVWLKLARAIDRGEIIASSQISLTLCPSYANLPRPIFPRDTTISTACLLESPPPPVEVGLFDLLLPPLEPLLPQAVWPYPSPLKWPRACLAKPATGANGTGEVTPETLRHLLQLLHL